MKKLKAFAVGIMAVCSVVGMTGLNVSADVTESSENYSVSGDVNSDGKFTIADILTFQKWIAGSNIVLKDWKAVDFTGDGVLDVFDLCMMKNEFVNSNDSEEYPVKNPAVIDEFTPCTATVDDYFDTSGIHIEIKHQYSVSDRIWTVDDFKNIENIKSVSQSDNYNPTSSVVKPYRQIITIELEECSKENVLKMVKDIEALNLPEIKEVRVFKYGTGLLPMTPEEWEEYVNSIREEEAQNNQQEEYPVKNPVVIDEFTPCTATVDDYFDTSGIHIEIKHQYSVSDRVWTIDDFKGIDNIKSVSQDDCNNFNLSLFEKEPYRQIVTINLEECSKANVLKMVKDIEALNLPEIKEVYVFKYGTGALPMTPEEWEEYVNSIKYPV